MINAQEKISEELVNMLDGMRGTVCDQCGIFKTSNHGMSVAARLTSEMFISRWFPISEALPNEGECVLALVDGMWRNITLRHAVQLCTYYEEGWLVDEWPGMKKARVSHWMPLPPLPCDISKTFEEDDNGQL